jgi:predicted DNA-binding transcriptional regulator AlpA
MPDSLAACRPIDLSDLVPASQLMQRLGIGHQSLRIWIVERQFPPPKCTVGKVRYWSVAEVEAFLARHQQEGGGDAA